MRMIFFIEGDDYAADTFLLKDLLNRLDTRDMDPMKTKVTVDLDKDESGEVVRVKLHCSDE